MLLKSEAYRITSPSPFANFKAVHWLWVKPKKPSFLVAIQHAHVSCIF